MFAALCSGMENDNHTWSNSFERHYPMETGNPTHYGNVEK
tara:strand:- start:240 stop:359 length:120 start_codon:yes stop_codon:yes gene_type:complete